MTDTDPAIAEQLANLSARLDGFVASRDQAIVDLRAQLSEAQIALATLQASVEQISLSSASLIESLEKRLSAFTARVVLMEKLLEELEIDTSGGEH